MKYQLLLKVCCSPWLVMWCAVWSQHTFLNDHVATAIKAFQHLHLNEIKTLNKPLPFSRFFRTSWSTTAKQEGMWRSYRYEIIMQHECISWSYECISFILAELIKRTLNVSNNIFWFPLTDFYFFHQRAVEVMCFVPKRCNDMMNVGRLQGFDVRQEFSFLFFFCQCWSNKR